MCVCVMVVVCVCVDVGVYVCVIIKGSRLPKIKHQHYEYHFKTFYWCSMKFRK